MIIAIILIFLGNASKGNWVVFIRSLQIILIMALLAIPIPANNLNLLHVSNAIAFYDIMGQYDIWSYFPFLKFKNIDVPLIVQQMQNVTYSTRNAFLGLGSVTLYMLAYLIQIFFALLLQIIFMISGEKFIKKKFLI